MVQYAGTPAEEDSIITVDTIFPATEKHICKHSKQALCIFEETPGLYQLVTKPYIEALPAASIAWVNNILAKKKEAERLLFEDFDPETGFMLHPDLKWDESQVHNTPAPLTCWKHRCNSSRATIKRELQRQAFVFHAG